MNDMQQSYHIPPSGTICFVQAYAKINLTLDVLGRRSDGYHELATIMQTVDLYDTLCLSMTDEDAVRIVCVKPELCNDENLAVRAAQLIRQHYAIKQGLVIELHKRIPIAAGLGGGSSNAAAILLALQQWWHLASTPADLLAMAASLGSDIPFFLTGGLALCEGRGERVTPIAFYWPPLLRWLLLVKPAIGVSTATVFRNLPPSDYSNGAHSRAIHIALQEKRTIALEDVHNSLERGVLEHYPQVAQTRNELLQAGASFVRLSGSGPTLFAPFSDLVEASQVQQHMQAQGYEVYLTCPTYATSKGIFAVGP